MANAERPKAPPGKITSAVLRDEDTGEETSFEDMGTMIPGGHARLFIKNAKPDVKPVTGKLAKRNFARSRQTDPFQDQVRRQRGES